jgi:hypothetical protein
MCSDPNSPDPGAFCLMRGMCITMLVFGILDAFGVIGELRTLASPGQCFICPTGALDFQETGGHTCFDEDYKVLGDSTLGSEDDEDEDYTEEECEEDGGEFVEYSCQEAHTYWSTNHNDAEAICGYVRGAYDKQGCCIDGPPPPDPKRNAQISVPTGLIAAVAKIIMGGLLSCCAGPPTPYSIN